MKTVLSIAGSDPSGGAGIQADLKTISAHQLYGMSAITALTAQNTQGVFGIHEIPLSFFDQQLCAILDDIRPDAIKIGMLGNREIVSIIAKRIQAYHLTNIVIDPVMVSTSGCSLIEQETIQALQDMLFPLANIITPNMQEAEVLANMPILTTKDMETAAYAIRANYGGAILIKGGHLSNDANDLLLNQTSITWLQQKRIPNMNTHGTGCTLSSAIACNLAQGKTIQDSVVNAKAYVTDCIAANLQLGKGNGPLDHMCRFHKEIK